MTTKLEECQWKLYKRKYDLLFNYGLKKGLITSYDNQLLENLRHIYYAGIPASILLLNGHLCNGHCYDMGTLITLGFDDDDFQVVDADVDSIRLNSQFINEYEKIKNFANHCFAERILKDGKTLVYDTSVGLVFEKSLYYKLENPHITKVNDKKATLNFLDNTYQKDTNIKIDQYFLSLVLPYMEKNLVPIQPFYLDQLKKELE